MERKMIVNDIRANKLLAVSICFFMTASAFLAALAGMLSAGLLGSVEVLMEKAKTPDFLQMHTGTIEEEEVFRFAGENEAVESCQILKFLNLSNASLTLGGHSMTDSTQDNGVCTQSASFDFLLDMENEVITVREGEIYVPVCYRQEYGLEVGQTVQIEAQTFAIAGFLRDSQMSSMMASSKRFLVCGKDYERLCAQGTEEYLIEFLLREETDVNVFAKAYADAKLPANGPAITRPLIRMMNALSEGLLILVVLLVCLLMLFISLLCIRFTLLTKLQEDQKEIGLLKAIGIGRWEIRRLYFGKYALLSAVGAVAGLCAAYAAKQPLLARMQELYGAPKQGMTGFCAAVIGSAAVEGCLLLGVRRTLKRIETVSAVSALTGRCFGRTGAAEDGSIRQYALVMLVIALCSFMMTVPQNLKSTISSPQFVTYMGIGDGEIRLDLRQTEDISGKTARVEELLAADGRVARYAALTTRAYHLLQPDGSLTNLYVEFGDHTVFPVTYEVGGAPLKENDLALSILSAEDLGVSVGGTVTLLIGDARKIYSVCGIYSDITNGGRTAKAVADSVEVPADGVDAPVNSAETAVVGADDLAGSADAPVMWSIFYVSLKDDTGRDAWMTEYQNCLSEKTGTGVKVVDIGEYVTSTYGQTIRQIGAAAGIAVLTAAFILFVVVLLFVRLIVAKEQYQISLKKALGVTASEIGRSYLAKLLAVSAAGIVAGTAGGIWLGEQLAGMFLRSLGAAGFRFLLDVRTVGCLFPMLVLFTAAAAAIPGLSGLKKIKAYECCQWQ